MTARWVSTSLVALTILLAAGAAQAQSLVTVTGPQSKPAAGSAPACRIDDRDLEAPIRPSRGVKRGESGQFDYYLLALSWSPAFCADAGGRRDATFQCERNRFGFVVHGLWPQWAKGSRHGAGYPQFCAAQDGNANQSLINIDRRTLRDTLCTVPGVQLMQHQWVKHGTCTGLSGPAEYFGLTREIFARLTMPELPSGTTLSAGEIAKRFLAANAAIGLSERHIRITSERAGDGSRQAEFDEIRVCLSRDLKSLTDCDIGGVRPNTLLSIR